MYGEMYHMGKVFGYPEFDEHGERNFTTYDNEYKDMMMDIRVYKNACRREENIWKRA